MEHRFLFDHSKRLLANTSTWAEQTLPWQFIHALVVLLSVLTVKCLSICSGAKCFSTLSIVHSSRQFMLKDPHLERELSLYTDMCDVILPRGTPADKTPGIFLYYRSNWKAEGIVSIHLLCCIGLRQKWQNPSYVKETQGNHHVTGWHHAQQTHHWKSRHHLVSCFHVDWNYLHSQINYGLWGKRKALFLVHCKN